MTIVDISVPCLQKLMSVLSLVHIVHRVHRVHGSTHFVPAKYSLQFNELLGLQSHN